MDVVSVAGLAHLFCQFRAQGGAEGNVPGEAEDCLGGAEAEEEPGAPQHHKGAGRAKPSLPEEYTKKLLMIIRDMNCAVGLADVSDVQDRGKPEVN